MELPGLATAAAGGAEPEICAEGGQPAAEEGAEVSESRLLPSFPSLPPQGLSSPSPPHVSRRLPTWSGLLYLLPFPSRLSIVSLQLGPSAWPCSANAALSSGCDPLPLPSDPNRLPFPFPWPKADNTATADCRTRQAGEGGNQDAAGVAAAREGGAPALRGRKGAAGQEKPGKENVDIAESLPAERTEYAKSRWEAEPRSGCRATANGVCPCHVCVWRSGWRERRRRGEERRGEAEEMVEKAERGGGGWTRGASAVVPPLCRPQRRTAGIATYKRQTSESLELQQLCDFSGPVASGATGSQPFSVDVSSAVRPPHKKSRPLPGRDSPARSHDATSRSLQAMLVMDFHAHLSTHEVIGLLGGVWDPAAKAITIK